MVDAQARAATDMLPCVDRKDEAAPNDKRLCPSFALTSLPLCGVFSLWQEVGIVLSFSC
jgi:hypothetical protein